MHQNKPGVPGVRAASDILGACTCHWSALAFAFGPCPLAKCGNANLIDGAFSADEMHARKLFLE